MAQILIDEAGMVIVRYTRGEYESLKAPVTIAAALTVVADAIELQVKDPLEPLATVKGETLFAVSTPSANALRSIAPLVAEIRAHALTLDPPPVV